MGGNPDEVIANAWKHYKPARLDALKPGSTVLADAGFRCIAPASILSVKEDECGLYVKCSDGRHYLDGQLNEDGTLAGLVFLPPVTRAT